MPHWKRTSAWRGLLLGFTLVGVDVSAYAQSEQPIENGKLWVTSERLNRRTCPDTDCGVVGRLFYREGVDVFERSGDWVRISKHYPAPCESGRNAYVDSGNGACTAENGVANGMFAEWVSAAYLSADQPADPSDTASGYEELVASSDDFARYRSVFADAAHGLILDGTCTEQDFIELGGWVKSSNAPDRPIYFAYCGGMTSANKIYLDAATGGVGRNP